MNRSRMFVFVLMSLLVLAWSPAARSAGDPVRGNALYHTTYHCTDCHDPNPSGAYATAGATVAGILDAIANNSPMTFRYGFTLAQNQTDLADLAAYLASVAPGSPPPPTGTTAVEYYYADWNFYFETSFPAEIAALDGGAFGGVWKRTGQTFNVWTQASDNAAAVPACRFFSTAFAPKSAHFYTPFASECALVKTEAAWQYEAIAFYIALADANGNCGPGTIPLYRLYNNGMGGAPNHRYTTSLTVFDQMAAAGWIFEGNGNTKVFACVPQ